MPSLLPWSSGRQKKPGEVRVPSDSRLLARHSDTLAAAQTVVAERELLLPPPRGEAVAEAAEVRALRVRLAQAVRMVQCFALTLDSHLQEDLAMKSVSCRRRALRDKEDHEEMVDNSIFSFRSNAQPHFSLSALV